MRKRDLERKVEMLEQQVERLEEDLDVSVEGVIWTFLRDEEFHAGRGFVVDFRYAMRRAIASGAITRKQAIEALGLQKEES